MADYTDRLYADVGPRTGGGNNVTYVDNGERKTGTIDPSYWAQMENSYEQQYADQVAANNQALENARSRAQEAAQAQIDALRQQYQGTNRQLYRDYMRNQRALPQQMSALGYNGGMSESGRLRLANAYGEALAENERARMGQEAGYNQTLAQQLYEAQAAADSANRRAEENRLSYVRALREAQRQDLMTRAATMAGAGDFSLYGELGYTPEQIGALYKVWAAQNPELAAAMNTGSAGSTGGTGGSGGHGERPEASLRDQVAEVAADGADYAEILALLKKRLGNNKIDKTEYKDAIEYARQLYGKGKGMKGKTKNPEPVKPAFRLDFKEPSVDEILAGQANGSWNGFG